MVMEARGGVPGGVAKTVGEPWTFGLLEDLLGGALREARRAHVAPTSKLPAVHQAISN